MGEPVLVLHGVANRKPKEFDDVVTELQVKLDDSLGESYKLTTPIKPALSLARPLGP